MHCNDGQYVNSTFTFSSTIKLLKSKYESVSCHPPFAQVVIMLVKSIEVTLNNLKRETEFRKLEVLYQQCLNRLSKVQGTTITEEALLEVPGFSEFVLSQIQNRMDYPPRKRKADESVPSKPAKKRQSGSNCVDEDDNGLWGVSQAPIPNPGEGFKPQPGSGAFAIVKALSEESPPSLRKEELKDAASKYSSKSMNETGPFSAWKEMTILLRKKIVIRTGKGAEESFILTAKGKEVAEKMEGPNKKKEEFLREI